MTKKKITKIFNKISSNFISENFEARLQTIYKYAPQIIDYLNNFKLDNEDLLYTQNYVQDAIARFLYTLSLIPSTGNSKILEIGSNPYLLTTLINKIFKPKLSCTNFFDTNIYNNQILKFSQLIKNEKYQEEYKYESTLVNVENQPLPYKSNTFDIILFCEVLEHLIVDPLKVFKELHRILKKKGYLLITTPNASRLTNIATLLQGENIFDLYHPQNGVFGRHNREFTIQELKTILIHNNFKICYSKTHDRFDYNLIDIHSVGYNGTKKVEFKKNELIDKLKQIGANVSNIGDNLYVLCQK